MTFDNFLNYGISYFIIKSREGEPMTWQLLAALIGMFLLAGVAGYFLGSFNSAVFFSKKVFGCDIRTQGSKNAAMSDMFRVFGKKAGFLTLIGDIGKAVLASLAGYVCLGSTAAWFAGLGCIMGHMFPFCNRFRGGNPVIVAAVVLLMADWLVFAFSAVIFAILLLGTKMVSLSSVISAFMLPLTLKLAYTIAEPESEGAAAGLRTPIAVIIMLLIVAAYWPNLKRVIAKEEPKIRMPWEKKAEAEPEEPKKKKQKSGKKDR